MLATFIANSISRDTFNKKIALKKNHNFQNILDLKSDLLRHCTNYLWKVYFVLMSSLITSQSDYKIGLLQLCSNKNVTYLITIWDMITKLCKEVYRGYTIMLVDNSYNDVIDDVTMSKDMSQFLNHFNVVNIWVGTSIKSSNCRGIDWLSR